MSSFEVFSKIFWVLLRKTSGICGAFRFWTRVFLKKVRRGFDA
jgi:hypothetical protein